MSDSQSAERPQLDETAQEAEQLSHSLPAEPAGCKEAESAQLAPSSPAGADLFQTAPAASEQSQAAAPGTPMAAPSADSGASTEAASAEKPPEQPKRRILIGSQRGPSAYQWRRRDWIPVVVPEADSSVGRSAQTGETAAGGEGVSGATRPPGLRERKRRSRRYRPGRRGRGAKPAGAQQQSSPAADATAAISGAGSMPAVAAAEGASAQPVASSEPTVAVAVGSEQTATFVAAKSAASVEGTFQPAELSPSAAAVPGPQPQQEATVAAEVASPTAAQVTSPVSAALPGIAAEAGPEESVLPADVAETPMGVELPAGKIPVPSPRRPLSKDLEEEFAQAMAGESLEALIAGSTASLQRGALEPQSKHTGRVVAVGKEDVFIELGGREQGSVALRLFDQPPEVGSAVEVVVERFNVEDGLYELSLPQKPVEVDDWGDLREGMLVEARVTAHNVGGLECRVNNLRAFIPASQVALYRVENLQEFVGQTLECLVTEADRQRRNLVLSRRAVLERQREEARQQLLASLQPGQVREGVVRRLTDFGAFVDLGGVDGLLHVSQLAWHRVQHPSEVLSEGQRIQVRIEKVDPETKKISLAYRDLLENPWSQAAAKYPPQSIVRGKVTKLMEYGAFVELEPGIEGLVHISELSPKRVWRVSDVVKEGDEVDALVLSVDAQAQRIGLSIKALSALRQPQKTEQPQEEQEQPASQVEQPGETAAGPTAPPAKPKPRKPKPEKPLLGGLDRPGKSQRFGLKW